MSKNFSKISLYVGSAALSIKILGIAIFTSQYSKTSSQLEFQPESWLIYFLYFGTFIGILGMAICLFTFAKKQRNWQLIVGGITSLLAILINPMTYSM